MNMIILSEVLLKHGDQITTFAQLTDIIQKEAIETGTLYFQVDIEPPVYPDRPHDWHDQLELAFESAR
jgi:hypothetical protein